MKCYIHITRKTKFGETILVDCDKDATKIITDWTNKKTFCCGYHAKTEMNRSKKYNLNFKITDNNSDSL